MLNLGLFMMPLHPANKNFTTSYEEDRQLVKLADKLNFSEAWMGEHYSSTAEPVTSPLIFHASLISETKKIKFGTGVISLPQQHPAVVAGQVSLLDHLSKGRVILGVGAGGLVSDWELFDNMDGRSRALTMIESVEAIIKFWEDNDTYSYKGEFLDISLTKNVLSELGIGKFIKPFQQPYPEIAVSLKNPNSMTAKLAGEKGWILFQVISLALMILQHIGQLIKKPQIILAKTQIMINGVWEGVFLSLLLTMKLMIS